MNEKQRKERNEKEIASLHPAVQERAIKHVKAMEKLGFLPLITDGYRSIEEQNALYAKGRTNGGRKVTNARGGQSWHNWRLAYDMAFIDRNGALTYNVDWNVVGREGKSVGMTWGGDWTFFKDRPHFQFTKGLTINKVQRSSNPIQLINEAMKPYVTAKVVIPNWAKEAVEWCKKEAIALNWDTPDEIIINSDGELMMYRAGQIEKLTKKGVSKLRLAVWLYRNR